MDANKLKKVIKQLPVTPGVLGKEENYFNSAVLITLVELNGEHHFLFEKRSSKISQGDEICFPGGKYEPEIDINYQATAIRETTEELGIDSKQIQVMGNFDTIVAPMGATIDSFVSIIDIDSLDELNIDKREVAEVFTVPVSYFQENPPKKYQVRLEIQPRFKDIDGKEKIFLPSSELGLPERYHTSWGGKKYNIYLYNYQGRVIWGITAQLIREFIRLSFQ